MSMRTSLPWLAPHDARRCGTGGNTGAGRAFPLLALPQRPGAESSSCRSPKRVCRMPLNRGELFVSRSRGDFCRACYRQGSVGRMEWQPGRERPPQPPSRWGSMPLWRGSLTPRLRVLSVRTDGPSRSSSARHSAGSVNRLASRRAQRRETVTTAALSFLNGRTPCH
jgi:hypothetical protein